MNAALPLGHNCMKEAKWIKGTALQCFVDIKKKKGN